MELAAAKAGEFLEHGWGGAERSVELARGYYTKAGAKGQDGLGRLDEADRTKAELQRLTDAAEGGDAASQLQLGGVLEYGWMGSAVDLDRAESMYRRAADAGNGQAQYTYGLFLIKNRSRKYLQLAADQGNYDASTFAYKISNYF
jgi:TPR repeat protein